VGGGITAHACLSVRSLARAHPIAAYRIPVGVDISQTRPPDDAVSPSSRETARASHTMPSDILLNTDHTHVCRFEVLYAPTS
jgi:hypothetical protein